jgi:hypothetical protein
LSLSLQASKLCFLSLLSLQASKQPINQSGPYLKLITLTSLFVFVAYHSVVAIMSGRNQHVQPTNQPPTWLPVLLCFLWLLNSTGMPKGLSAAM